jgi:hypothetical protein
MYSINFFIIISIIIIGLPVINYNFRIIFLIILLYYFYYPKERDKLLDIIQSQKYSKTGNSSLEDKKSNNLVILLEEGNSIIKELKQYKKVNKENYYLIKDSWSNIKNLVNIISSNSLLTYPHHLFSSLKDERVKLLNNMSSLIISNPALDLTENTLTKDRTLPLDNHIRILIRKISVVLDNIFNIIQNIINTKWDEMPYIEINPVEWNTPEGYNQNKLDVII